MFCGSPSQGWLLQTLVSSASPVQSLISVVLQSLVRVWFPVPHGLEQEDHSPQCVHSAGPSRPKKFTRLLSQCVIPMSRGVLKLFCMVSLRFCGISRGWGCSKVSTVMLISDQIHSNPGQKFCSYKEKIENS